MLLNGAELTPIFQYSAAHPRWLAAMAALTTALLLLGQTAAARAAEPWSVTPLSQTREDMGSASVGTTLLLAGGRLADGHLSAQVDLYNAAADQWTTAKLSEARADPVGAAVGTKVVFAGGQLTNGAASDVVDIYDSTTGQWSTARLSVPRTGVRAAVANNQLVLVGATNYNSRDSATAVDIFDADNGTWTTATLTTTRPHQRDRCWTTRLRSRRLRRASERRRAGR